MALALRIGDKLERVAAMRNRLYPDFWASTLTPDDLLETPGSEPWRHLWLGQLGGGLRQPCHVARSEQGRLARIGACCRWARRCAMGGSGTRDFIGARPLSAIHGLGRAGFLFNCLLPAVPALSRRDLARAGTHRTGQRDGACVAGHD